MHLHIVAATCLKGFTVVRFPLHEFLLSLLLVIMVLSSKYYFILNVYTV